MTGKFIYNVLLAIGGPISAIGGAIGNDLAIEANKKDILCNLRHDCPDPTQNAIYWAIPGALMVVLPLGINLIEKLTKTDWWKLHISGL
jgi:hypothetical protein